MNRFPNQLIGQDTNRELLLPMNVLIWGKLNYPIALKDWKWGGHDKRLGTYTESAHAPPGRSDPSPECERVFQGYQLDKSERIWLCVSNLLFHTA